MQILAMCVERFCTNAGNQQSLPQNIYKKGLWGDLERKVGSDAEQITPADNKL